MMGTRTMLGALVLVAAGGGAWAAEPGWVVRVCPDKAYTWAHAVEVEVTDGQGKNKQDLVDWTRPSTQTDFPVAAPLAAAPTLRIECDGNPYDAQVYLCVLYGGQLVRTLRFLDELDATVAQSETDTGCPCMSSK